VPSEQSEKETEKKKKTKAKFGQVMWIVPTFGRIHDPSLQIKSKRKGKERR
jgi:hypothetical protein